MALNSLNSHNGAEMMLTLAVYGATNKSSQVVFNELVSIAQVLHNNMEKIQIKHTRPILITKHKKST